ncbi:MAG: DUF3570 domain-containing protein [Nitrospiria bacterium]
MIRSLFTVGGLFLVLALMVETVPAIEPPDDKVSVGYNFYDGGGITVQGPALIIRKDVPGKLALEADVRVDLVSSASIDVVTQASPYTENRKEYSIGTSSIFGDTLMTTAYVRSDESDYTSDLLSLGLAHDLLDKNLTLTMKVARSWDQVGKNDDPGFGWKESNRAIYMLGLAQSLTARWLVQFNYELTADDGFLNNPYRSAMTLSGGVAPENYPEARTGHAVVVKSAYGFLSKDGMGEGAVKHSVQMDYRYYQDTFDVQSHSGKFLYQRHVSSDWLFGISYRYYRQGEASFYGDRLPANQIFKARDKELSRFSDQWIGGSIKFKPQQWRWPWIEDPYFKLGFDFLIFDYDNFTDPRTGDLYSVRANVLQASFGFNY